MNFFYHKSTTDKLDRTLKPAIRLNSFKSVVRAITLLGLSAILYTSCDEKMPTRENPENLLRITSFVAQQGIAKSGRFKVAMRVTIQNFYEETMEDTVSLEGEFYCWWKNKPNIGKHYEPGNGAIKPENKLRNGILKLDPGESVFVDYYWYFYTDNDEDILEMLDYSNNDIRNGFQYAIPETFVIETHLKLFRHLPELEPTPLEIEVTGFKPILED